MRKILLILLALLLAFSAGGCSLVSREAAAEPERNPDYFVAEALAVPGSSSSLSETPQEDGEEEAGVLETEEELVLPTLAEDDPLYESVMHFYKGLMPIFCYFAFEGKDYDLENLEAEDFWLFMALAAAGVNEDNNENVDQTGEISLTWNEADQYAAAFFPAYFAANGLPGWEDTYSAYADPGSQNISLHAISVDGYDGSMAGFWESETQSGCYETVLEVRWTVLGDAAYASADSSAYALKRWTLILEPTGTIVSSAGDTASDASGTQGAASGVQAAESDGEFAFKLVSYTTFTE